MVNEYAPLARFNGLSNRWLKPKDKKDVKTPSERLSEPHPAVNGRGYVPRRRGKPCKQG